MDDLISRQAAIDAVLHHGEIENNYTDLYHDGYCDGVYDSADMLKDLPSAEPRIIRCKDCKHRPDFRYDDDGDRYVEGPRYQETLKNGLTVTFEDETCPCVNGWDFYYSYIPKDDWYCANGERREEE